MKKLFWNPKEKSKKDSLYLGKLGTPHTAAFSSGATSGKAP